MRYIKLRAVQLFSHRIRLSALLCIRNYATIPTVSDNVKTGIKKVDDDMLETISIDNLPRAQRRFAKQFEEVNLKRIKQIFKLNYRNIRGLLFLLCIAVSVYFYTIYSVKQETLLEEIDQEIAEEMMSKDVNKQ